MADKLTEMFNDYRDKNPTADYDSFTAGFTASAVSMRARAVEAAQTHTDRNEIINAIGALSDIPE